MPIDVTKFIDKNYKPQNKIYTGKDLIGDSTGEEYSINIDDRYKPYLGKYKNLYGDLEKQADDLQGFVKTAWQGAKGFGANTVAGFLDSLGLS